MALRKLSHQEVKYQMNTPKPHLDESLLSAYLDNELSDSERETVEQALENSPEFRSVLQDLKFVHDSIAQSRWMEQFDALDEQQSGSRRRIVKSGPWMEAADGLPNRAEPKRFGEKVISRTTGNKLASDSHSSDESQWKVTKSAEDRRLGIEPDASDAAGTDLALQRLKRRRKILQFAVIGSTAATVLLLCSIPAINTIFERRDVSHNSSVSQESFSQDVNSSVPARDIDQESTSPAIANSPYIAESDEAAVALRSEMNADAAEGSTPAPSPGFTSSAGNEPNASSHTYPQSGDIGMMGGGVGRANNGISGEFSSQISVPFGSSVPVLPSDTSSQNQSPASSPRFNSLEEQLVGLGVDSSLVSQVTLYDNQLPKLLTRRVEQPNPEQLTTPQLKTAQAKALNSPSMAADARSRKSDERELGAEKIMRLNAPSVPGPTAKIESETSNSAPETAQSADDTNGTLSVNRAGEFLPAEGDVQLLGTLSESEWTELLARIPGIRSIRPQMIVVEVDGNSGIVETRSEDVDAQLIQELIGNGKTEDFEQVDSQGDELAISSSGKMAFDVPDASERTVLPTNLTRIVVFKLRNVSAKSASNE